MEAPQRWHAMPAPAVAQQLGYNLISKLQNQCASTAHGNASAPTAIRWRLKRSSTQLWAIHKYTDPAPTNRRASCPAGRADPHANQLPAKQPQHPPSSGSLSRAHSSSMRSSSCGSRIREQSIVDAIVCTSAA